MNGITTVLVISDDQSQFASATLLMREHGYRVLFASNILRGLKAAAAESPELIISELAVPDIDGPSVCRRVLEDKGLRATRILLVGDLSKQSSIVVNTLKGGASGYLQKPIHDTDMLNACRSIVQLRARSIADRSKLENACKNEILRAALFAETPAGLAMFSPSGYLVENNAELLEMLDNPAIERRDITLSEFIFPFDPAADNRAINEVVKGTRKFYRFKNGYLNSLGERIWGTLTIVAIPDEESDLPFVIGIFEDAASRNHVKAVLYGSDYLRQVRDPQFPFSDIGRWTVDKGLICKN